MPATETHWYNTSFIKELVETQEELNHQTTARAGMGAACSRAFINPSAGHESH